MTNAEMNRRLNTLTDAQYHDIVRKLENNVPYATLAADGYSVGQVRAVAQAEAERAATRALRGVA